MPRTNEKDTFTFSHDCNARNDPKILALRSVYGAEGYGVYFMLIEILREQPGYRLAVNEYIWTSLAMQMQVPADRLEDIITACCVDFTDRGGDTLLINDGDYLYSASLLRRMDHVERVSRSRSASARKRWENQACKEENQACKPEEAPDSGEAHADAMQMQSKRENLHMQTLPPQVPPSAPLSSPRSLSPGPPISHPPIIPPSTPSSPSLTRGSGAGARKGGDPFLDFARDDPELSAALAAFSEMRQRIRKPMTRRAKELMLSRLEKLSGDRAEQIAILNQSIERSWAGVFPLKDEEPRRTGGQASGAEKMGALRNLHDAFSGGGV